MTLSSRAVLWLLCGSGFAAGMVESGTFLLMPPYLVDQGGFEPAAIGVLLSIVGAASLLARMPVGRLYGAGRGTHVALGGAVLGGSSLLALAGSPSWVIVPLALAGIGVATSIGSTVQLATLTAWGERRALGSAIGWYTAAIGVGNGASGFLGGWLADSAGIPVVFMVAAGILVAGTCSWLLAEHAATVTEAAPGAPERTRDDPAPPRPAETDPALATPERNDAQPVPGWDRVLARWRDRTPWDAALLSAFVLVLVMNGYLSSVTTFHPIMAVGAGLTLRQIGILSSARSFTSTGMRVAAGLFLRRTNGERLIWPLVLLGSLAIALLPPLRGSVVAQVPLFVAMGMSRGLLRITGSAVAMSGRDSAAERGRASAIINAGLDVGKLSGPLAGSALVAIGGVGFMFPALAVAGLVAYWAAWVRR